MRLRPELHWIPSCSISLSWTLKYVCLRCVLLVVLGCERAREVVSCESRVWVKGSFWCCLRVGMKKSSFFGWSGVLEEKGRGRRIKRKRN